MPFPYGQMSPAASRQRFPLLSSFICADPDGLFRLASQPFDGRTIRFKEPAVEVPPALVVAHFQQESIVTLPQLEGATGCKLAVDPALDEIVRLPANERLLIHGHPNLRAQIGAAVVYPPEGGFQVDTFIPFKYSPNAEPAEVPAVRVFLRLEGPRRANTRWVEFELVEAIS